MKIKELSINELRHVCDAEKLGFANTKELPPLEEIIAQDRAMHALSFGMNIKDHGYHIIAVGPCGTGKTTTIHRFLEKYAKTKPVPADWLYVNNFEDPDKPRALQLPAGKGRELKEDMDGMVEELKTAIFNTFDSKEYAKEQEKLEQEFEEKNKHLFESLEKTAEAKGFKILQTPRGITFIPAVEVAAAEAAAKKAAAGEATEENPPQISAEEQAKLENAQKELMSDTREIFRQLMQLQKDRKNSIKELDNRIVGFTIEHTIEHLKEKYVSYEPVIKFLTSAQENLTKNIPVFKQMVFAESAPQQQKNPAVSSELPFSFDDYRVNVVIDNTKVVGAPVIIEKNPTGQNLIGRIEHQEWYGTLVTNFRMIKAGSLHRANGGYLIIEAFDLVQKPYAWQILKRALKNDEVVVESMVEAAGMSITRTLQPEPIPLRTKVVLIGDYELYHLFYTADQEFQELFKIKADFETSIDWNLTNVKQYAQFIGTVCADEKLKHFTAAGVGKIVEFSARLAEHRNKLSTNFGEIIDLVRQAVYWSQKNNNKLVQHDDVNQALEEKIYRSNRIEKVIQEMMQEGSILIDVSAKVVGQINGLAVISLGDYSFGRPSKITASTYLGNKGVIHIEREARMSGPIHNKGALILAGYLGNKYGKTHPLTFSASITFEQMYEGIEGDSASSTEIYALLSSLSDCPIRQDIAVTGSVNQWGEIQPIGGVNEKIEGFFQVCKIKGLSGTQGVMIPYQNVNHLMLNDQVIDAVKKGKFHIYAVTTIDEGIEILTGKAAGKLDKNGAYPKGTINYLVQNKIITMAKKVMTKK